MMALKNTYSYISVSASKAAIVITGTSFVLLIVSLPRAKNNCAKNVVPFCTFEV
jgi:hypothetical protein